MASKAARIKAHRNMVYAKYNGKCALCGDQLEQRWCIWPMSKDTGGLQIIDADGAKREAGQYDLPSCPSCHGARMRYFMYNKKLLTIDEFRDQLYDDLEFLGKHSMCAAYYQRALRYGLIQETGNPIVFYFERT